MTGIIEFSSDTLNIEVSGINNNIPIDLVEVISTGQDIYVSVQTDQSVLAVNGRQGFITLNKSDVGLQNVENISITGVSGVLNQKINNLSGDADNKFYLKSNPSGFVTGVTNHAASHAAAGSDPVTPAAIGAAATNHSHQPSAIYCDAVDVSDTTLSGGEPNGIYLRDGSDNGKAIYKSAQGYALWWDDGEEEWVLGNVPQTAKYYIGTGDTEYPWQATAWALGPQGSGDTPVVDQALLSNFQRNSAQDAVSTRTPKTGNASSTQVVLGNDTRLTNSRTPTAHAASHAAAGSDPIAPSDIGAQSVFISEQLTLTTTAQVTLSAARAKVLTIVQYAGANVDVVMPQSGFLDGDVFVFKWGTGSDSVVVRGVSAGSPITTISAGQQKRVQRVSPGGWVEVAVDTHTHPAASISDSTTAGRALLTGADAAAQRTSLGLGTAATSASTDFYSSNNPSGYITGVDTSNLYPRSNPSGFIGQDLGTNGKLLVSDNTYGNELGILTDNDEVLAVKMLDGRFQYGGGLPGSAPLSILNGNISIYNTGGNSVNDNPFLTIDNGINKIKFGIRPQDPNAAAPLDDAGFIFDGNAGNQYILEFLNGADGGAGGKITFNNTGYVAYQQELLNFYTINNPSGFITGIDLSSYATNANLNLTGFTLNTKINILSGVTVLTFGDQIISGTKYFNNSVYIHDLYVTGTEFIANVQNNFVESPYILLNLTGGAIDGGIFFVTGSGLTGVNDYGPIIGFDHSNKFKFGTARRSDDLSTLNDIAAVQDIQNYSGFVNGKYSTIINLESTGSNLNTKIDNLSGYSNNTFATAINLASTGSSLDTKINNYSGFVNNNVVFTAGDQTISGVKTFQNKPAYLASQIYIESGINLQINENQIVYIPRFDDINTLNCTITLVYISSSGVLRLPSGIHSLSAGQVQNLNIRPTGPGMAGGTFYIQDAVYDFISGQLTHVGWDNIYETKLIDYNTVINLSKLPNSYSWQFLKNNSLFNLEKYLVYNTGNQTISGTKTFATRPAVNNTGLFLSGEDLIANKDNLNIKNNGRSITIEAGSGIIFSDADVNIYAGRNLTNQPYSSAINFLGNINFNQTNSIARNFNIYKTGLFGATPNLSVTQNSVDVDNKFTISGVQVTPSLYYTKNNPSGFITQTNLNQASGNLQSQIDILNVNSIAYAIALG